MNKKDKSNNSFVTVNMKRKKVFQIFMETSFNIYLYLCRHFIENNIYKTNNLCYFNNCFYIILKFTQYSIAYSFVCTGIIIISLSLLVENVCFSYF